MIHSNIKSNPKVIEAKTLAELVEEHPVNDECMVMNGKTFPRLVELLKRHHEFKTEEADEKAIKREKLENPKGTLMLQNDYMADGTVAIMDKKMENVLRLYHIPMEDKQ
jgi:hypothetical protein